MKILVQGTKGGAKIFYPQETPDEFYSFAGDVRDINGSGGVGETAYSIALTADGCILSKYLGVRDVQRSWEGNVSFSLFLSHRQTMAGEKIQALLDELLAAYESCYINDGNLGAEQEDWSFISEITSKYEQDVRRNLSDEFDITALGVDAPAFLFYDDIEELRKYFEFPYQREYLPYKQVFFLDKKEQTNPRSLLNALRHNPEANLTGKVDLQNPRLSLFDFDTNRKGGVTITLKANGNPRRNRDKFYRKDELELIYSKPGYRDKVVKGRLSDPFSEINNYVKIVDGTKVDVKNNVELDPERIEVTLKIVDEYGGRYKIEDGVISVRVFTEGSDKHPLSDKVTFIGEETLKWWTAEASISDLKGQEKFRPSHDAQSGGMVEIMLRDKSSFELREPIPDTIREPVREKQDLFYLKVDSEKGEYYTPNGFSLPQYVYSDPEDDCKAKKGYKFERWDLVREMRTRGDITYQGYFEAQFKELWWHKIPGGRVTLAVSAVVVAGLIALACWWMMKPEKNERYDKLAEVIDSAYGAYKKNHESVRLDSVESWKVQWSQLKPDSAKDPIRWENWKLIDTILQQMDSELTQLKLLKQHKEEAEAQWNQIKDSEQRDDFNSFLDSITTWGVTTRKGDAEAALQDIQAWEEAKAANKINDYETYLTNHLNGRFIKEANSNIKSLQKHQGASTGSSTSSSTTTGKDESTYINEFWALVKSQKDIPKTKFDDLFTRWKKDKNSQGDYYDAYYKFYDKYISTNEKFDKYYNQIRKSDRRASRSLDELTNKIPI